MRIMCKKSQNRLNQFFGQRINRLRSSNYPFRKWVANSDYYTFRNPFSFYHSRKNTQKTPKTESGPSQNEIKSITSLEPRSNHASPLVRHAESIGWREVGRRTQNGQVVVKQHWINERYTFMSLQKISIVYAHSMVSPRSCHLWACTSTSYVKNMIPAAVVRQATGWCAGMLSDNFMCILSYQHSLSRSRGGSTHHLFVCSKASKHIWYFFVSVCRCGLAAPAMVYVLETVHCRHEPIDVATHRAVTSPCTATHRQSTSWAFRHVDH